MFKNLIAKLRSRSGQANAAAATGAGSEAGQSSSQAQQAEKLEGLIADVDLSDVPEEQRATVKKLLTEKVKLYDAGYRAKTETVAEEKRAIEQEKQRLHNVLALEKEIRGNPALEKKVNKIINDFRAGVVSDSDSIRDRNIKKLDKLISEAEYEDREKLRELRSIISEEAPVSALEEKIKALELELQNIKSSALVSQEERVNVKIGELEKRFGKKIVDKYKPEIKSMAIKYPNQNVTKLFYHLADDEEIAEVLLAEKKVKQEIEDKRKEEASVSGLNNSIRRPITISKDKHGRTNLKELIKQSVNSVMR